MRIALLAPLEVRVPPLGYGGIELVVSLLCEGMVRRGHQVTLFASGDSITTAALSSVCSRFLWGTDLPKPVLNMLNVFSCFDRAGDFDLIHNHTEVEGAAMPAANLVSTPVLTTLHDGNLQPGQRLVFERYCGWHNSISRSAERLLGPVTRSRAAGVIYNAIEAGSYPFSVVASEPYMVFLGRISEQKGPHLAIEVARRTDRPLILAGPVDEGDMHYFRSAVEPGIDGVLVRHIGEVNPLQKRRLLDGAYCLLAPITWEEPFGLFMIEAMACGVPVIALNRGAAAELVLDEKTGFVVSSIDEMCDAIQRIGEIDRRRCRLHVEENFDVDRMVDDYIAIYRRIVEPSAVGCGHTD
jgi:glycosyltransferase involved in cell wall biosynthesis